MRKFEEAVNRAMNSSSNNIMEEIDLYINKFAKKIYEGYGYITEDDVLRQFFDMFPSFDNQLFNRTTLKLYIIDKLKEKNLIKSYEEIDEDF
jgi:succinate dehydrogenase flavin-adding protein (antitoxin of CptAB toxin-antitoxin module)